MLALAAYFFQKWLGEIEEKIAGIKQDVKYLKETQVLLTQEIKSARFQLSKDLQELPQLQAMINKLESIERVKEYLRTEFLPKVQENQVYFGKIVHLENKTQDFENRLLKVFKAVEILAQKRG